MDAISPATTIGALSARTGCNIETIRYYERIGVMPKPPRSPGGHRLYAEKHLKRLTFICRSRALGFSLAQVRDLLRFVDGGGYTCSQVKAITSEHLGSVRGRIADLKRLEKVLKEMVSQCDQGKVPDCPVIDALSRPR
ncbi:MAG: helix-turn-helix domain-containing protein [Gammaproteobacteria bacterium]|jgi:MerR family mercuric resistance operon transcriptional regulator|nr:helix-turn-helix domain-containing protein [Gammaproteobacteria bacterium]